MAIGTMNAQVGHIMLEFGCVWKRNLGETIGGRWWCSVWNELDLAERERGIKTLTNYNELPRNTMEILVLLVFYPYKIKYPPSTSGRISQEEEMPVKVQ